MKLLLKRTFKGNNYTIGKLYIDGAYFCDTLEDPDRGLKDSMSLDEIRRIKIYGDTAIPSGSYKIDMNTVSPRFKNRSWARPWDGKLPRLTSVPGYEGVLIHVGNKPEDTSGCILVGFNKVVGQVINSTTTFDKLCKKLLTDKDNINITIE